MISLLKGNIKDLEVSSLTILTSSGVGYEVLINELIYSKLILKKDLETEIYIYHHKTENSENLFGFLEIGEKKVFKELIKISGVGGKVAMQIIGIGITRLLDAISSEDNKTIEGIKGIGKKSAEKIILELKDKDFGISFEKSEEVKKTKIDTDLKKLVLESLTNMGYDIKSVEAILSTSPEELDSVDKLIPYIIKNI
ncbi:hypothetical protein CSA08_01480 [Candidatus Gracilibacteria bacterium]|nr:MAG: hypothetical protein CSA08_01480 [Candidatus Gracilibacteria bacterium]